VRAPRVNDRRPGARFVSALLPPYMRRSPKVSEVLPLLYLRGLSTGDFVPALSAFFSSETGLSASTVSRLTEAWRGSMTAGSAAVGMMIKPGPNQIITPMHPSALLEVAQPPFQPLRRRARSLPAPRRPAGSATASPPHPACRDASCTAPCTKRHHPAARRWLLPRGTR